MKGEAMKAPTPELLISPQEGGKEWSAKRTRSQLLGFANDERPLGGRLADSLCPAIELSP